MDLPTFIRSLGDTVGESVDAAAILFDVSPHTAKSWLYRERYPRTKQSQDFAVWGLTSKRKIGRAHV